MSRTKSLGSQVNIEVCRACNCKHEGVEIKPYASKDMFSHYYLCPKNGDPVSLILEQRKRSLVELNQRCTELLADAEQVGSFMCAVFRPDKAAIRCNLISWNFNDANHEDVKIALQRAIDKDTGAPPVKATLHRAETPGPGYQLFGKPKTLKVEGEK